MGPGEASGQHLNPPLPQLWPHNWQPGGSQAGGETTEEGAGAREIPEHVASAGIHTIDMQIKHKLVLPPPNHQIWPPWQQSMPDQLGVPQPLLASLSLSSHPCLLQENC